MEGMEGMESMGGATTPDNLMQLLTSTYFNLLRLTTGFALHLTESSSTKKDHYFE